MSRLGSRALFLVAFAAFLTVPGVWAQTTGRIAGTVTDTSGAPLPGVVLSARSPSLQGVRSTGSAADGEYRLLALSPGTYTVRAEISGFRTVEEQGVVVGLDQTVTLPVRMAVAGLAETIQVTAESPVVDTTNAGTGLNATADLFTRLPLQRTFDDVARLAAGTQQDGVGMVVYGSSGAENSYVIEGLNTTGVDRGVQQKNLNFDFVDEIEVKTGGMPAEYGRMTGGAINVLTKSGSNDFHGSVFGFFEGKGLAARNTTVADLPVWSTTVQNLEQKYDFGASLGGYVLKDKLWFFGAYNRVNETDDTTVIQELTASGSPSVGSVVPATTQTNLFSGKLTWRIGANHTLTGSVFGDPNTVEGNLGSINGPATTWQGTADGGAADWVARYDGVVSSSLLIRAQYGHHEETFIQGGPGANMPLFVNATVTPAEVSGGFGGFRDTVLTRDQVRVDVSKFWGTHEIKVGGDWQGIHDTVTYHDSGSVVEYESNGIAYYFHPYTVNDTAPGYDPNDPATWQAVRGGFVTKPSTEDLSAYAQDSWRVWPGLTLNLGLRWEEQNVKDRFGKSAFKLTDNWAPRLGFAWDVRRDGRSKLYAAYGRYHEDIPQDIDIRAFTALVSCACYNFDPSLDDTLPDPSAPRRSTLVGGAEPVDPNLQGQYLDEWIAGFDQEVARNFSVGVKATYRTLGRVIEDFLVPSKGYYFIANPGEGTLGQTLGFYDWVHTAPSPKAQRTALAFEATARKRFSDNWQLLASYVWQRLEGNYDGTFQSSTGQLDPNINSAFDYADFLVNAYGHLTSERQHQVKLNGSYQLSSGPLNGLNVGLSTYWYSGRPLTAYGYSFAYHNWEYYLTPRGSLGRGPSDWEASLHVNYPIEVGSKAKLDAIADVFNLFNRQAAIELDQTYNLVSDGPCAGIPDGLCNGDGGLVTQGNTLTPVARLANPRQTATNPGFLRKGTNFTQPRSVRLGVRLTF